MKSARLILGVALALSCGSDDGTGASGGGGLTTVRVELSWSEVEIVSAEVEIGCRAWSIPQEPGEFESGHRVVLVLDEERAGQEISVSVWGIAENGARAARGIVRVSPAAGEVVDVDVTLDPCASSGCGCYARRAGGSGTDTARDLALAEDGSFVVAGFFGGDAQFGGEQLDGIHSLDLFLARYASDGTVQWAKEAAGQEEDVAYATAFASGGDVLVAGAIADSAEFGSETLFSSGGRDAFAARYDSGGEFQSALRMGGIEDDAAFDIAATPDDGAVVVGGFQDFAGFGDQTLFSDGRLDVFVAQLDASGDLDWLVREGGEDADYARAVAVDPDAGAIYVTGAFGDDAEFGDEVIDSVGSEDAFLARYDFGGVLIWVLAGSGAGTDEGRALAITPTGEVILAGTFEEDFSLGDQELSLPEGVQGSFVSQVTSDGEVQWITGSEGGGDSSAESASVSPDGCIFVSGWFDESLSFSDRAPQTGEDPPHSPQAMPVSRGDDDAFYARYTSDGTRAAIATGGGDGNDAAWAIVATGGVGFVAVGEIRSQAELGGIQGLSLEADGGSGDPFVWACE